MEVFQLVGSLSWTLNMDLYALYGPVWFVTLSEALAFGLIEGSWRAG